MSATTHPVTTARTVTLELRTFREVDSARMGTVRSDRLVTGGVPNAAHRPDDRRRLAQLGPHLRDVHVDGAGAAVRGVTPDRAEQLVTGVDPAGPAHQV